MDPGVSFANMYVGVFCKFRLVSKEKGRKKKLVILDNNMEILIKRIKHPTDISMRCCLLLRYQEYRHNHFASPRTCYWPSAHPIST